MKTTLNLPDDLMRAIKVRAAQEGRTLQDLIADLLRRGMSQPGEPRVRLPLVQCAADEEMTPERAALLIAEEVTEEQARRLREEARRRGISMAEMVRLCLERLLADPRPRELYARAASWVGGLEAAADLSEEHDRYLDEAFDEEGA